MKCSMFRFGIVSAVLSLICCFAAADAGAQSKIVKGIKAAGSASKNAARNTIARGIIQGVQNVSQIRSGGGRRTVGPIRLQPVPKCNINNSTANEKEFYAAIAVLENKSSTQTDISSAIARIQKLADSGYGKALNEIGTYYATGENGIVKDCTKALAYLTKAWNAKELQAANNLAILYRKGECMEPDTVKSMEWLRKGANAGYPQSMHDLGLFYLEPNYNQEIDSIRALGWFRKAAEAGYGPSMYQLSRFYHNKGNLEEFRYWIKRGVEAEDMYCLHGYAISLGNGSCGFKKDPDEAAIYVKKAADLYRYKDSALQYGYYCIGKKKFADAVPYFTMVAEQGSNRGMWALAMLYAEGMNDVPKDTSKYISLLNEGYETQPDNADDYNAQLECGFLLAKAYYFGSGVPKDTEKGINILKKLANLGHQQAKKVLNSL